MWATADHYNLQGFGKFYRQLLVGDMPKISLKFKPFSKTRAIQAAYIQLRTGISSLKSHLRVLRKTRDSICWCCSLQRPQTTKHILLQCPAYAVQRSAMQDALEGAPLSLTLRVLFRTAIGRKALEAFLSDTKICTA
jgi:hypothetical protein